MTDPEALGRQASRSATRILGLVVVGFLAVGATACSTNSGYRAEVVGAVPDDYRVNHPITIEEMLATLDVPVGMETRYLPRGMDDNIAGFARAFLQSGSDIIAIVIPDGSANVYAANSIGLQIEQVFLNAGVPRASIQYRAYPASGSETSAPIRLAYAELRATVERCGPWTDNVARNFQNQHYEAFGCASQYNLAAMVANPLDLLYPRIMPPPNAARRDNVLGNYQDGEATDTNYAPDVGNGVAEVAE